MRGSSLNKFMPVAILACLAATACSPEHEIDRPGTWKPTGANDYNLRAMVADRRDLEAGVPSRTDRAIGPVRAINRLMVDRRRPLLNVTTSTVGAGAGSSEGSGGGDAGGMSAGGANAP